MRKDFDWDKIKSDPDMQKECVESSLEAAIQRCDCLGQLFRLWKIAHTHESNAEKETFPVPEELDAGIKTDSNFCSSFCPDGYLGEKKEAKILFICRESNCTDHIEGGILQPNPWTPGDNSFWLKSVVAAKASGAKYANKDAGRRSKAAETKYYNCLRTLKIQISECDTTGKGNVKLSDCAYLNINKRGGFGRCNAQRLRSYANKYANFIRREIQLIQPDHIVCLGTFNLVKEYNLIPQQEGQVTAVYDCYHPCSSRHKMEKHTFQDGEWDPVK